MNNECVFCRIAAGELPSTRVYEDDACLAFMDIGPIVKGHVLVIPRAHHERITDVPGDLLAAIMQTAARIAAAQVSGLRAEGVNLHQANGAAAGQVVPHVHVHVIPRFADDGHAWNWRAGTYETDGEVDDYATAIRESLD